MARRLQRGKRFSFSPLIPLGTLTAWGFSLPPVSSHSRHNPGQWCCVSLFSGSPGPWRRSHLAAGGFFCPTAPVLGDATHREQGPDSGRLGVTKIFYLPS